ncbi:PaaI family thioesterase [Pseudonocardia spinosispora]|uniref:PaaI family thioesterase n=1 Tax=Pseudonocardia spinosispora TaxID=103441 RepID=UPI0003FDFD11|nr:PaaI family thioesterase [Pseudonocardia spinosispora]
MLDGVGGAEIDPRILGRLSTIPVDSCLGVEPVWAGADSVRLRAPIPRGSALAEDVGPTVTLAAIADAAGGWAMAQAQGLGLSGPTIELRVDHAAPPVAEARWMIAESSLRYMKADAGYVTVEVTDEAGRPLGHAQGHFVMLPPDADAGEPLPVFDDVELDRPEPLLAAVVAGSGDPSSWTTVASRQLSNPRAQVHGGVLMAIGQVAQRRVQLVDVEDPTTLAPLSVQVEYLRPAMADGGELRCRTEYVRRGRRFRTLRTDLVRGDGKIAAVVTGLWSMRS